MQVSPSPGTFSVFFDRFRRCFTKMLLRNVSHNAAVTFTNRSYIGVLHILHRLFHTVMSTVYQSEKYPLFDLLLPPSAAVAQGFPHPGANGGNRARRAASAALLKTVGKVAEPLFRKGFAALRASWPLRGHFDTRSAQSVFCHAHVAAEHGFHTFHVCGRETLRGFSQQATRRAADAALLVKISRLVAYSSITGTSSLTVSAVSGTSSSAKVW